MERVSFKKSEYFLGLFRNGKMRVHALILALSMVLSIFVSGFSGAGSVHAEGEKEITVDGNGLSVDITINGYSPLDPDVVYEGDQLGLSLSFSIPAEDLTTGTTYVYNIPNNIVYTGSDTTGNIVIPAGTALSDDVESAGTYEIRPNEGKVYFYITDEKIYEYNTGTGSQEENGSIAIPVAFNCEATATLGESAGGAAYSIPGFGGNLTLIDNTDKMGMVISKSMSNTPDANGYIDCAVTVEVPADKKYSYSTIDVTDTFLAYDNGDVLTFVDNSLSVKKVSGGAESSVNEYTFSGLSTQDVSDSVKNGVFQVTGLPQLYSGEKYVIEYKLQSLLSSGDKIAFNKATAESSFTINRGGNDETFTDTQSARVDYGLSSNNTNYGQIDMSGINPQTKISTGTPKAETSRAAFGWKITVTNSFNTEGLKNTYTIDSFDNDQYIDSDINPIAGVTVTYLKADGTYGSFDEAKDASGRVYGLLFSYYDIAYGESVEFSYSTYVDFADMPDYVEVVYYNSAEYNYSFLGKDMTDLDEAARYYMKPKDVHKYVLTDKDNPKTKAKNISKIEYSDTNNTVYYGVMIDYQEAATDTTQAIDKLPTDCTFGGIYAVYPVDKDGDNYVGATQTSAVTADTTSQPGKVVFNISKDAFHDSNYGDRGNGILIVYSVILPSEKPSSVGSDGVFSALNTVSYNGKMSSVTIQVQYEADAPILEKEWLDDKDEVQTKSTIERSFRVVINPDKKDLDPNKDTLTLNDLISMKLNEINSISLEKIHLYEYSETAAENKGENRDEDMTFTEETRTNTKNNLIQYLFALSIPDESAYVLEYTYVVSRTNYSENGKVWFDNHVNLNGKYSTVNTYAFKVSSSSASSTVINPRVMLYKVDSENYKVKLSGAKFSLEKLVYNGSDYEWQEAISSFSVDSKGTAFVGMDNKTQEEYKADSNTLELNTKTVYKLTEIEAPAGYTMSSDSVYFVIGSGVNLNQLTSDSTVKGAVDALAAGTTVSYFVTNSNMSFANEKSVDNSTPVTNNVLPVPHNSIPEDNTPLLSTLVNIIPVDNTPVETPVDNTPVETPVETVKSIPVETTESILTEVTSSISVGKPEDVPTETADSTAIAKVEDKTEATTEATTETKKAETTATTETKTEVTTETSKTDDTPTPSTEVTKEKKDVTPVTSTNTVKTSDEFGLPVVIVLMLICAAFSAMIIVFKRKNSYK